MIFVEVEANPNCSEYPQMVYSDLEPARPVAKVRIEKEGKTLECWVISVEKGGAFVPAQSQKVTDSGAGTACLVYGGEWGVRLQLSDPQASPWDLSDKGQWGEPYLLLDEEGVLA